MMAEEITRRSFVGLAAAAGIVVAGGGALSLVGCGGSSGASSSAASVSASESASASASGSASASASEQQSSAAEPESSSAAAETAASAGSAAVVFFSRADENYNVGVIEEGNTAKVAKEIAAQTGAELIEIKPATAYPAGYDECCDVAQEEQDADARPALAETPDLSAYDTIYLGFPIWWGQLPMLMYTLLEGADTAGKTIAPFNTHEGSGKGTSASELAALCPDAALADGLAIRGTTAQNEPAEVSSEVSAWLETL